MKAKHPPGRKILAAEKAAGVKHHMALSVVGTERLLASGYFRAKMAQEKLIKKSPISYTIAKYFGTPVNAPIELQNA